VLVEHARSLVGITDASHAESSADGTAVVTALACSLDGQTIEVQLTPGSRLAALHGGAERIVESTTCNYGLSPEWQHIASEGGMTIAGIDDTGEARAVERQDHPFFLATLYQPQLRSRADAPHPIWVAFLAAVQLCVTTARPSSGNTGAV
jgi:CTP synthase (UTP-ammonia lyase)